MLRTGIHELPFITEFEVDCAFNNLESDSGSTPSGLMTVKDDYATLSSTVKDYVADPRSGLDEEYFYKLVRKPAAKLAFGWLSLDSYCILGALQPAYPADNVAFSAKSARP